ncbi:MAG: hypothetical protein L6Q31_11200 [Fimbriimonadaceae bacterium]|nr:hypothetical protein [Fimbriimonadaceae bacterium]NUM39203.1 hypothetical protein [Armatimonadota bacterium]
MFRCVGHIGKTLPAPYGFASSYRIPPEGRLGLMRIVALPLVGALVGISAAQGGSPSGPFATTGPDVSVVITEHATGADIVEITATRAEYPAALLSQQISALGKYLNSEPRVLRVFEQSLDPENQRLSFLKATFAVDGLIDRRLGVLRLEPLARAFAGAASPNTVQGLSVIFDGELPTASTIQSFESTAVSIAGRVTRDPTGIEYRIRLKTQKADEIRIPESANEQTEPQAPSSSTGGPPAYAWVFLGLAGIAAGALVYFALLRSQRAKRP